MSTMVRGSQEQIRQSRNRMLEVLRANHMPYRMRFTSRTYHIDSAMGHFVFSGSNISARGLGLMSQVKGYIKRRLREGYQVAEMDYTGLTKWMMFNTNIGVGKHGGIMEVDIDKAYWVAAYQLGLLSEAIYEKGLRGGYSKVELAACLGSLAKRVYRLDFDGEREGDVTCEADEGLDSLWQAVCWRVDRVMDRLAQRLGDAFYFYWIDAVFFKDEGMNTPIVMELLAAEGFSGKAEGVAYLVWGNPASGIKVYNTTNRSKAVRPRQDKKGRFLRIFAYVHSFDAIIHDSRFGLLQD